MVTAQDIRWGMVAPFLIAIVALVFGHIGRNGKRDAHPWSIALAIGASLTVAYIGVIGRLSFPPKESLQWPAHLGVAVLIVAVVASQRGEKHWLISLLSILVLLATAILIALRRQKSMEPPEFRTTLALAGIGLVVWWAAMEPLARRMRGFALPLLLSGIAGGATLVIIDSGSRSPGLVVGAIAIVLLAMALMSIWLNELTLSGGGILAIAVAVYGMLLANYLYADVKRAQLVILAAAPLLAWAGELPIIRTRRTWIRFAICAALVLGLAAFAVVPALQGLQKTMAEQVESYQY